MPIQLWQPEHSVHGRYTVWQLNGAVGKPRTVQNNRPWGRRIAWRCSKCCTVSGLQNSITWDSVLPIFLRSSGWNDCWSYSTSHREDTTPADTTRSVINTALNISVHLRNLLHTNEILDLVHVDYVLHKNHVAISANTTKLIITTTT